jgi:S1-C subfamily serine protease
MNNKKVTATILIATGIFVAGVAASKTISFSSILPAAAKSQAPLSDEQQGILAVRTAKASVVDIVGVAPVSTSTSVSIVSGDEPTAVYGTGFILESDGLIVSNNHVVSDPTLNYTVILSDGTEYPAKILGQDKYDDVALLQINAANLTPAKLGNSDALETGQTVFAIGDSLGEYQYSVTRGVVSALGRAVSEGDDGSQAGNLLRNLIQTDAAISPGNSGGPLVDLAGEVVGMNTLIDTEGESLGFAVPVNTIKDAVSQLKTFGKVSRPFLGVQFNDIDPVLQVTDGLVLKNGALVVSVVPGSPADLAGIVPNDTITAINNITLGQNESLDNALDAFGAGSQVTLTIYRNNGYLKVPVILGELQ